MPERAVIADTGPIVAFLHREEPHHAWTTAQFRSLRAPLLTCEAVMTEAAHFLRRATGGVDALFELLARGTLKIDFTLSAEHVALRALIGKYEDAPMSLADACLVRMAELHPGAAVLTFDSHFAIYRKRGRQRIATITP